MNRFLGDSPIRVLIKLVVLSFVVGLMMSAFGWTPRDVALWLRELAFNIWYRGFDALDSFIGYFLLGAAVVIPAFLVVRLLSLGRRPRSPLPPTR